MLAAQKEFVGQVKKATTIILAYLHNVLHSLLLYFYILAYIYYIIRSLSLYKAILYFNIEKIIETGKIIRKLLKNLIDITHKAIVFWLSFLFLPQQPSALNLPL